MVKAVCRGEYLIPPMQTWFHLHQVFHQRKIGLFVNLRVDLQRVESGTQTVEQRANILLNLRSKMRSIDGLETTRVSNGKSSSYLHLLMNAARSYSPHLPVTKKASQ